MAMIHGKQRSYASSNNYSKKGYSLLKKYLDNTNEALNKLKFVEDDSANESEFVFPNRNNKNNNNNNDIESLTSKSMNGKGGLKEEEEEEMTMKKACQCGNLSRVKQLVELMGKEVVRTPDEQNVYPLHWAAINNRLQVARYLLEKGI